jgi:hypothetical protein
MLCNPLRMEAAPLSLIQSGTQLHGWQLPPFRDLLTGFSSTRKEVSSPSYACACVRVLATRPRPRTRRSPALASDEVIAGNCTTHRDLHNV